ncbi:MAG: acyltransferase [Acidimicrobiales bacterium]|nr:acyltransferase [Acidimicrobiales bacterium]
MPTQTAPKLADLAAEARPDRNRAIDAYRALAMLAVAIGHWAAISVALDDDGALRAGNALAEAPQLAWITWIFQVMPLFFVVGGFSSAMSLDAHARGGGRGADWVVARLRRMLAPAVVLGGTWLALLVVGSLLGAGGIVVAGAIAAAIPLWFLANYTIDTAIAPMVLPAFRRRPGRFVVGALAVFAAVEALHVSGVPLIGHVNWVLGWLLFQVAGFAWRDGLLPTGRRLVTVAAALWTGAVAAVAFGPWPVAMVHHEGLTHSPTHPPSIALLLFGGAYSTTAVALAPWLSGRLARSPKAWAAVVAGNAVSLTVYLWHFTAFVVAAAGFYALGWLPTASVASAAWWLQKLPMMFAAAVVLTLIVALVSGVERRALLAPRQPWRGSEGSMLGVAALVSIGVKIWGLGSAPTVVIGSGLVLLVWFGALRPQPATARH